MSENDFDFDLIDYTSVDDVFFLWPEMIKDKDAILIGTLENDKRCLEEEIVMKRYRSPPQSTQSRASMNALSRTATITKKRPEAFFRQGSETCLRNPYHRPMTFYDDMMPDPLEQSYGPVNASNMSEATYTCSPTTHERRFSHRAPQQHRQSTDPFFNQSLMDTSRKTYTVSPPRRSNGPDANSFFDASFHQIDEPASFRRSSVMSRTYDIENNDLHPAEGDVFPGEDHFPYNPRLPSHSRTSSSETFTKACDLNSCADSTFDTVSNIDNATTASNGTTSLSSDDLSVDDNPPNGNFNKYHTYSKIKNHHSSRNIPLSFSSNLSSVSSVTGGSESSLNSGLRMNTSRLANAIGSNGSQTISRGKIMPPSNYVRASAAVSQIGTALRPAPRASNLIKPKTLNGSRMRLPTNGTRSNIAPPTNARI